MLGTCLYDHLYCTDSDIYFCFFFYQSTKLLQSNSGYDLKVDGYLVTAVLFSCSQYIFRRQEYNKPFFSTFTKTSMFVLYLLGFLLWRPWRQQCTSSLQRPHTAFVSSHGTTLATGGRCCTAPSKRKSHTGQMKGFNVLHLVFIILDIQRRMRYVAALGRDTSNEIGR